MLQCYVRFRKTLTTTWSSASTVEVVALATMAHRLAWDYILKFIIIGDASVGKSSLLVRLTEDRFLVHSDTTIGIEFGSHIVTLPKGERLKLQIWDTAGSEQFRSVRYLNETDSLDHPILLQGRSRLPYRVRCDAARDL